MKAHFALLQQDVSISGKRLSLSGERSVLVREAIRLARELGACLFVENVQRAVGAQMKPMFHDITLRLAEAQMDCTWLTLRAFNVGCPQSRARWFGLAYPQDRKQLNIIKRKVFQVSCLPCPLH